LKLLQYQFSPTELSDESGPYIEVVGITDLHYGAATFLPKKAEKHRKYILESVDRKAFDLGDHCESALSSSPGDSAVQQKDTPDQQSDWVADYYGPMRDKLLGIVTGNHEDRSAREGGISIDKWLTTKLGVPWVRWEAIASITVGTKAKGQNYTLYTRHAVSNSSKPGQVLNAMIAQSRAVQGCDAYLFGHNHFFMNESMPVQVPDPRHGKVRVQLQHFVMGDAFMARENSYAENRNFPLANPGQFSLKLYRDTHRVDVKRLVY
jgi:hypothetical protein